MFGRIRHQDDVIGSEGKNLRITCPDNNHSMCQMSEFGVFSADKETVFIRPASIHLFICA